MFCSSLLPSFSSYCLVVVNQFLVNLDIFFQSSLSFSTEKASAPSHCVGKKSAVADEVHLWMTPYTIHPLTDKKVSKMNEAE